VAEQAAGPGGERDELWALVSDLRQSLLRHARGGRWAASAAASPGRVQIIETAANSLEPGPHADAQATSGHGAQGGVETALGGPPAGHQLPARHQLPAAGEATEVWPSDEPSGPRPRKTLEVVRAELGDCQRCKLAPTRQKRVFGAGAADAALVFVGEAPGADEDRTGEPFVGRAGELLDKMIEAMGWSRSTVYIANLLKCRPPGNRNPEPDEARECRPFLLAQLDAIAPRIIVSLGRPASNALLGNDAPISALRGKFHQRLGVKIMPTFHPAYLLRDPSHKREAWDDLKQVMAELERIGVAARR
jgi:uracil-DNA glycosylase